ncbi:protein FAM111A-like [Megalops cyprinoides]|uniref:protein FAM111A-like n=1 Tax=Megalops cyprinoides TaxID=118141 RepID=UPI0018650ED4|nr:protein FAM111A-like [Megalops cyprinoides]
MISTVQLEEDTTDQVPNEKENQREMHRKKGRKKRPSMKMSDMETLHKLSMSVCQVCVCGRPCGSGFLLFGGFILTNAHVVRNIRDSETGRLLPSVTVTFENLGISEVHVELKLIVYQHGSSHHVLDYALLQLVESQTIELPPGLLSMCGQLPQHGEIYIIGYPGGGEKEVSLAVIVEFQKRAIAFSEYFRKNPGHIGAIIGALLKENWSFKEMEDPYLMTYDTSFLHGSSGSPVFLCNGRLVSMHTGGYSYEVDGETYSIIEYAIPIMPVLEDIMWQLLNSKDIPMQQKLEYFTSFIGEAWKGFTDMIRMIAFCLTEVLMRLSENQLHPLVLHVVLGAVEVTEKHAKTWFRKALREAMDMKPSLKGISKQGLVDLAKTQEEQSSLHALGQFLFPENQRGALTDITVNTQGANKWRKRGKGKNKGGGKRGEGTLRKGLYRL